MSENRFHFNRVLLIDDSEIDVLVNRRLIELTRFASSITITRTAEEALHFLIEECNSESAIPDWIFLDMHLPIMSGFDFIEEFKKLSPSITGKSKIIILSVFQQQEKLQIVFENKFVAGQIDKPLTQKALQDLAANKSARVIVSS
jgi:CheY-like chemotaxis protein